MTTEQLERCENNSGESNFRRKELQPANLALESTTLNQKQENLSSAASQVFELISMNKRGDQAEGRYATFEEVLANLLEYARMGEREFLNNSRDETIRRFRQNFLVQLFVCGRCCAENFCISEELKFYAAVEQLCIPELDNCAIASNVKQAAEERLAKLSLSESDATVYKNFHLVFNCQRKFDVLLRRASIAAFSEAQEPDYVDWMRSLLSISDLRQNSLKELLPEYHFLLQPTESEVQLLRYACESYTDFVADHFQAIEDKKLIQFKSVWILCFVPCVQSLKAQLSQTEFSAFLNRCMGPWKFIDASSTGMLSAEKRSCLPSLIKWLQLETHTTTT